MLRHSMTRGNLEGRYIGCRTDEPLCREGIRLLKSRTYPAVDRIYASPMKRCVETAQVIWDCMGNRFADRTENQGNPAAHKISITLVPKLRECDFGYFENKNYEELNGDPLYQAWIDSNGTLPFPGGESMEEFKRRCQAGFSEVVREIAELEAETARGTGKGKGTTKTDSALRVALVVHGGTIMAVLNHFGFPKKDYFDYQVKNGCGYVLTPAEGTELWNYQCLP